MNVPGPLLFGSFAFIHACIALIALSLVGSFPVAAVCLCVVEGITAYDNLIIVLGRRIGINDRATGLNRLRFFLHAVFIGALVPVYTGIGTALEVSPFHGDAAMPVSLLAAAAIASFGYLVQYRGLRLIMPINYFGCLRYAQSVDDRRRYPGYHYSEAELANTALPPFASIITVLLGLGVSLRVGWVAGFWVPFTVTALMFVATAFPARTWGPLVTSMLEIIYSGGLAWSLWTIAASLQF